MPFRIQPETHSGPFSIDLESAASVGIENHGPGDAELAFDEGGMAFTVPLPAGTGREFPYCGDLLMGRLACRGKAGADFTATVIRTVFICNPT